MKTLNIPFLNNKLERNEYLVLLYRFLYLIVFYSVFRLIFWGLNIDLFPSVSVKGFFNIMKGGLVFDLAALLYLNAIYVVFYLLPLPFKFGKAYQSFLKWVYMIVNSVGLALNSTDIIYYRFILKRTTYNVFDIVKNEDNMGRLWVQFIIDYWYIAILFIASVWLLSKLYSRIKPRPIAFSRSWLVYPTAVVSLVVFTGFSVVAIRGGYRHSTRPMTMNNAGKYVEQAEQMNLVLNTPFCVIRTWGKRGIERRNYFGQDELLDIYNPEYKYDINTANKTKKNVVIIILESFNREYVGALNKQLDNGNYKGYTPFLDSLISESYTIEHAYANGFKSIDALPSIIASVPSLELPYIVSEYSTNRINGLPTLLKKEGYNSAFFHGAANGSMGFDAFAKMAGFDRYVGKTEYANDEDYDGMWGIWDEPFFQFFADEMDQMKQPFFTTLFSLSSHHPFKVPEEYEGVFPKGKLQVHQCIGYTDMALRKFFEKAQKMDWYQNTLFVLTADHSTATYFKSSKNNIDCYSIPMLFFAPGDSTLKGMDKRVAQQIDILPSVLSYVNYDQPFVSFGNNIFNEDDERFVIGYRDSNYQFLKNDTIIHFNGNKVTAVYDIASDRMMKNNLIKEATPKAIEQECKGFLQQYSNRMIDDGFSINQ
ncbi:LTA synthase family protein [Carboxylicivirga linearis]|uniref:Sulfatase-like hydrolase/transferase n=1 Tax=Carboxylicivirga linearis TaxID=1628157 RepID=A0ABS5JZN8_9BACT|nr:alkaline phosphatase family protein [Carboxylicivirga linearis]MBS2099954.1 sulfatase-like hydrolase/transferase [Carboxylicivirga linearis]